MYYTACTMKIFSAITLLTENTLSPPSMSLRIENNLLWVLFGLRYFAMVPCFLIDYITAQRPDQSAAKWFQHTFQVVALLTHWGADVGAVLRVFISAFIVQNRKEVPMNHLQYTIGQNYIMHIPYSLCCGNFNWAFKAYAIICASVGAKMD